MSYLGTFKASRLLFLLRPFARSVPRRGFQNLFIVMLANS